MISQIVASSHRPESEQVEKEALKKAEAAATATRSAATNSALEAPSSSSWWSNMSIWPKESNATSDSRQSAKPNTKD
jgi:hypothetical protein